MVNLEVMPCSNCMFCDGIKQPNGTENGEYVSCNESDDGKAVSNLKWADGRLSCLKRKKEFE